MVGNDLNIDELYSFYIKDILPVINDHFVKRRREKYFLFLISVGMVIGSIAIYSHWGAPHFIFLSVFLIVFIFVQAKHHVDLEYKSRIVSLALKFIDKNLSYNVKASSSVVNVKNSGLYPQINFEDCSDKVSAFISNIPVTVSFVRAKKVKQVAITRFSLGLILCILFIFICVNFFEKVLPNSLINFYFGTGLGIFFAYWFLSELNNIIIMGRTIFSGLLIAIDFQKKFHGRTFVFSKPIGEEVSEGLKLLNLSGLVPVYFDDTEFLNNFLAFGSSAEETHRLLTPNVRRSFCLAKERLGMVDFAFNRSLLFATVRMDSFLDESIFRDSDPFDEIAAFCSRVHLIFNTIDCMNIDNIGKTEAL